MLSLERQTTFGWLVSVDSFLVGTGAGVFLVSFTLDIFHKYEPLSKIGTILGPVLVLGGGLLLLADLGTRTKAYRLFLNPSSWMSRGVWIMVTFIIFGLAYSLPSLNLFAWLPWGKGSTWGGIIGTVAAVASVLLLTYTGLVLAVIKRIPLWNTATLPLLFLFSGLSAGTACLLLIAPFVRIGMVQEIVTALRTLVIAEVVLTLVQVVALGAYLETARQGQASVIESVRWLKTQLFLTGVIVLGLIVPLGLLFGAVGVSDISVLSALAWVSGTLLLIGGILLRYSIIRAGVYLPLY